MLVRKIMKINVNINELRKFLVKAKTRTYASQGEINETKLEDGGKRFVFDEEEFSYRDTYYGFNPFSGQEVVFYNKKIIWSMNYYGRIISSKVLEKQVYEFLKRAMRKINEDRLFRGPNYFKEEYFEYIDKNEGDVEDFKGTEIILFKEEEIYRLEYNGGIINFKN